MPEPISETSQPRPDQPHRSEAWTLLRSLYEAIPDPVWLKDPQGVYLACNPAFSAYYGAPEDIIVGKTDFDFVDAATAEFYRNKDWEAIAAGESCHNEEWFTYPDHQHRLFETTKTPISGPTAVCWASSALPATSPTASGPKRRCVVRS